MFSSAAPEHTALHDGPRPSRAWRTIVLSALLCTGCPDPNPNGAYTEAGGAASSSASVGGASSAPSPGGAGGSGTRPDDARFKVGEDEGVALEGTFQYEGEASGRMQIDFLTQESGGPPRLVHTLQVDKIGPWKTRAPKNFGELHIVAFIDKEGDGPSSDDPAARSDGPITIAEADVTEVNLILTDDPDLGTFTPGGGGQPSGSPPPDGPPPDGPPPDGPPPDGPPPEGAPQEGSPPDGAPTPEDGAPDAAPPAPEGTAAPAPSADPAP